MILCAIDSVEPGAVIAAAVFHPQRVTTELLEPGVALDARLLRRLRQVGVPSLWIHHDAAADLDKLIAPTLGKSRRAAYEQLRQDFGAMAGSTVTAAQVQAYRQMVLDLVCELMSNQWVVGLTDQMFGGPRGMFTHATNVAFLSLLIGVDLESYVVAERSRLKAEYARDLTALGVGAMVHDVGKLALAPALHDWHELHLDELDAPTDEAEARDLHAAYRAHAKLGYDALRGSRAPASATQIVLNHHQRWDGSGFPDMNEATGQRRDGTQQGPGIHIFSRIVAAANALDNLLRDCRGKSVPPVAALGALASSRFDGWFDEVVRDTVLRCLPPFAIGAHVTLSDNRAAVVITPSLEQPCAPTVRLIGEADRLPDGSYPAIDLRRQDELSIAECGGHDVRASLFELPERKPLRHRSQAG